MTLLAGQIIDSARGHHPAFDPTRHPNKVLLQYLSACARELHGKVTRLDPEALRTEQTQAMPLAVHEDGIALTANRHVVEVVGFDAEGNEHPVELIPATHRLDRGIRAASCWQIGATLYLTSPATLWERITSLGIAYVPIPATLSTLTGATGTLAVPDTAENCLINKVAAFMAKRTPKSEGVDTAQFAADATASEEAFLADIANRLTGQVIRTRDVYDP